MCSPASVAGAYPARPCHPPGLRPHPQGFPVTCFPAYRRLSLFSFSNAPETYKLSKAKRSRSWAPRPWVVLHFPKLRTDPKLRGSRGTPTVKTALEGPPLSPCRSPPFPNFAQAPDGHTTVNVRDDYGVGVGIGGGPRRGYIFSFEKWDVANLRPWQNGMSSLLGTPALAQPQAAA